MADMLRVFKSLSDRTRVRIVRLLLKHDLCVCELMFVLGMAQSRVSHQLRILRDAGLVEDRREGQWIVYRIPPKMGPVLGLLFDALGKGAAAADASDRNRAAACLRLGIRKDRCLARQPGSGVRIRKTGRIEGRSKRKGVDHGN